MAKTTKTTTKKMESAEKKVTVKSKVTEKPKVEKKSIEPNAIIKTAETKPVAKKPAPAVKAVSQQEIIARPKVAIIPPLGHGVGRRKSSVARAWLRRGTGKFTVNGKEYSLYFDTETTRLEANKPFELLPAAKNYNVDVNVYGGGVHSQAGAVKLGISRALLAADENFRIALRKHGLLTVDDRLKERKKYGQPSARAKFQFVKR